MNKSPFGPLTSSPCGGTMKEEARAVSPSRKTRRAEGPAAHSLNDFIMSLHTFVRDWAEVSDEAGERAQAAMLNELATLLKEEYDIRHGK